MPKPANDSRPPLAEMLEAFDPAAVAALAASIHFIANTCDAIGVKDYRSIGQLSQLGVALDQFGKILEKYND